MPARLALNTIFAMLAAACETEEDREKFEDQLTAPSPEQAAADRRLLADMGYPMRV